eukprot:gene7823-40529_t
MEDALNRLTAGDVAASGAPSVAAGGAGAPSVRVERQPLFLIGRYRKYDRALPQSPWVINGRRLGKSSLQHREEVARPLLPFVFPSGAPCPDPAAADGELAASAAAICAPADDAGDASDDAACGDEPPSDDGAAAGWTAPQSAGGGQLPEVGECVSEYSGGDGDIDVRMLGAGRPFVLEFPEPHNA